MTDRSGLENEALLRPPSSIMTPNGSLIAYTTPADIRELRDQVALVSLSWKEQLDLKASEHDELDLPQGSLRDAPKHLSKPDAIETLTIEFDKRNLIVRYLQPKLLLVLEGGVPPSRKRELKITAEAPGDLRYPSEDQNGDIDSKRSNEDDAHDTSRTADRARQLAASPSAESQASTAMSSQGGRRRNLLQIHRRKLDAMATTIKAEFERSGFEMPDDIGDRFF